MYGVESCEPPTLLRTNYLQWSIVCSIGVLRTQLALWCGVGNIGFHISDIFEVIMTVTMAGQEFSESTGRNWQESLRPLSPGRILDDTPKRKSSRFVDYCCFTLIIVASLCFHNKQYFQV